MKMDMMYSTLGVWAKWWRNNVQLGSIVKGQQHIVQLVGSGTLQVICNIRARNWMYARMKTCTHIFCIITRLYLICIHQCSQNCNKVAFHLMPWVYHS